MSPLSFLCATAGFREVCLTSDFPQTPTPHRHAAATASYARLNDPSADARRAGRRGECHRRERMWCFVCVCVRGQGAPPRGGGGASVKDNADAPFCSSRAPRTHPALPFPVSHRIPQTLQHRPRRDGPGERYAPQRHSQSFPAAGVAEGGRRRGGEETNVAEQDAALLHGGPARAQPGELPSS